MTRRLISLVDPDPDSETLPPEAAEHVDDGRGGAPFGIDAWEWAAHAALLLLAPIAIFFALVESRCRAVCATVGKHELACGSPQVCGGEFVLRPGFFPVMLGILAAAVLLGGWAFGRDGAERRLALVAAAAAVLTLFAVLIFGAPLHPPVVTP